MSEAPGQRGAGLAGDGGMMFLPRFAQVGAQVHKGGQHQAAVNGVHPVVRQVARFRAKGGHAAVFQQHVGLAVHAFGQRLEEGGRGRAGDRAGQAG